MAARQASAIPRTGRSSRAARCAAKPSSPPGGPPGRRAGRDDLQAIFGFKAEPRRIAARTVAARIAQELNSPLGHAVGYKVRFSDKLSSDTYVKVMTDGVLLAEIRRDRLLRAYDTIVVDEAACCADRVGLDRLTLAAVAQQLGVALPSLYKHVRGLDGLQRELALRGIGEITEAMRSAAVGRSGADALRGDRGNDIYFVDNAGDVVVAPLVPQRAVPGDRADGEHRSDRPGRQRGAPREARRWCRSDQSGCCYRDRNEREEGAR